ncbi:hypothetical protein [Actinokineospora cianjurensis]|uniref:Lysophospholipase L1-like esterase n=1 Tax=Actinokineospora cianjurensis TaxID=585224 RepID=A0A421AU50_9PSEU|nr:hypothetical protein [Actinokineospora cianjurensis]RLK53581.1 hypothetical protein CLV68_6714 [Actinokineospora cianjurensis]
MGGAGHPEVTRVLFVGNSFTYFHNLPEVVVALARPDRAVSVAMLAAPGAILGETWASGALETALREDADCVVLQEQSTLGGDLVVDGIPRPQDPAKFHAAVRSAVAAIVSANASATLYLTWARQDDPDAQHALTDAYTSIGKELGVAVSPVGIAWQTALAERPDLVLHDEDASHPAAAGSYLAACVLTATLFGLDPRGRTRRVTGQVIDSEGVLGDPNGTLVDLSEADAAYLQDVAWRTTC